MATTRTDVTGDSEIELGSPRSRGERLFMVACYVGVLAMGLLLLLSGAVGVDIASTDGQRLLNAGTGVFGLLLIWIVVRPPSAVYELWDRVYAGRTGVRAGVGGRTSYGWADIAGFEVVPARGGSRPRAFMLLRDGRRVALRALREVDDGMGTITNPGAVDEDVRRLNVMLRDAQQAGSGPG